MNFNRDYWVELHSGGKEIVNDISHFHVVDNIILFYRGMNVIFAVPVNNVLFFGGKDRVKESTRTN